MSCVYNRYIPRESHYTPVHNEGGREPGKGDRSKRHVERKEKRGDRGKDTAAYGTPLHMDKNAGIAGILNALKIEQLDSGDLLFMMIILKKKTI